MPGWGERIHGANYLYRMGWQMLDLLITKDDMDALNKALPDRVDPENRAFSTRVGCGPPGSLIISVPIILPVHLLMGRWDVASLMTGVLESFQSCCAHVFTRYDMTPVGLDINVNTGGKYDPSYKFVMIRNCRDADRRHWGTAYWDMTASIAVVLDVPSPDIVEDNKTRLELIDRLRADGINLYVDGIHVLSDQVVGWSPTGKVDVRVRAKSDHLPIDIIESDNKFRKSMAMHKVIWMFKLRLVLTDLCHKMENMFRCSYCKMRRMNVPPNETIAITGLSQIVPQHNGKTYCLKCADIVSKLPSVGSMTVMSRNAYATTLMYMM